MFCALLTSRYQVSVYRTNGPLLLFFYLTFFIFFAQNIDCGYTEVVLTSTHNLVLEQK